jgi:hypothetical protein
MVLNLVMLDEIAVPPGKRDAFDGALVLVDRVVLCAACTAALLKLVLDNFVAVAVTMLPAKG